MSQHLGWIAITVFAILFGIGFGFLLYKIKLKMEKRRINRPNIDEIMENQKFKMRESDTKIEEENSQIPEEITEGVNPKNV